MARIPTEPFLTFCRSLQGQQIPTIGGRSTFSFCVVDEGLEMTSSKRKRLSHSRSYIDRILDRFGETSLFTTSAYTDVTSRASYTLPLIKLYLSDPSPRVTHAASRSLPSDFEFDDIAAREGAVVTRLHLSRERDRAIIAAKIRQVQRASGRLACSVCTFDFEQFYGEIGAGFCEVHHLLPLGDAAEEVETRL